ncbi:MAG: hypothetical protein ABR562_06245, partial [Thermoplasmatota archaeon]
MSPLPRPPPSAEGMTGMPQMRRKSSIRTATGHVQEQFLERVRAVAEDPTLVLPETVGEEPAALARLRRTLEKALTRAILTGEIADGDFVQAACDADGGIVLAAQSAGAMCWFEAGITKSSGRPRADLLFAPVVEVEQFVRVAVLLVVVDQARVRRRGDNSGRPRRQPDRPRVRVQHDDARTASQRRERAQAADRVGRVGGEKPPRPLDGP